MFFVVDVDRRTLIADGVAQAKGVCVLPTERVVVVPNPDNGSRANGHRLAEPFLNGEAFFGNVELVSHRPRTSDSSALEPSANGVDEGHCGAQRQSSAALDAAGQPRQRVRGRVKRPLERNVSRHGVLQFE